MTLPGTSHPEVPVIAFPNLFNLNAFSLFSNHSKYRIFVLNATLNGAYISLPSATLFPEVTLLRVSFTDARLVVDALAHERRLLKLDLVGI